MSLVKLELHFTNGDIHRIRNFGETLFTAGRKCEDFSVDLEEVDRAVDRFCVTIARRRSVRKIITKVEHLMARACLEASLIVLRD